MITVPAPSLTRMPTVTPDRLQASIATLSELAAASGRDTAAGLLQGILRELRAGPRTGA